MPKSEIEKYVDRFNADGSTLYAGFILCNLISEDPIMVEYSFGTPVNAELFITTRQLLMPESEFRIDTANVSSVIETRK
jgi:hypothetical protein